MTQLPAWVPVLAALLTPTIAIAALVLGIANHRLAVRRRQDELFDRRYEFYQTVRAMWLSTGNGAPPDVNPEIDIEDLVSTAEEASFLFGDDIAKHIYSLEGPGHQGSPFFPNEDFVEPFRKYLTLEGKVQRE